MYGGNGLAFGSIWPDDFQGGGFDAWGIYEDGQCDHVYFHFRPHAENPRPLARKGTTQLSLNRVQCSKDARLAGLVASDALYTQGCLGLSCLRVFSEPFKLLQFGLHQLRI